MFRYQIVVGLVALTLSLFGGTAHADWVPERLQDQLKAHRFNLYASPAPANNMVLRDLSGRVLDLSSLRGKVVILNFWRIDCPPCASEKPVLERIYKKLADRGLEVVAVNLFDNPQRLRSYVRGNGYSFKFGFDPDNQFSLQRQSLQPGQSTTFVVNSGSEAIYEVPGVPTTYVIDRRGAVIGNSVGMVDWERRPFWDLLETLLQEPARPAAESRTTTALVRAASDSEPPFGNVARQGAAESPLSPSWRQAQFRGPVRQATPPAETPPATGLPFQGSGPVAPQNLTAPAAPVAPTPEEVKETPTPAPRKPDRSAPKPAVQRQRSQTGEPVRRYPAEPQPTTQRPAQPRTSAAPPRTVRQQAPGNLGQPQQPQSGVVPTPLPPPSPTGTVGSGALPSLPPALPYTPPSGRTGRSPEVAVRNAAPDENGNVMARIPPATQPYPGGFSSPELGAGGVLPPGKPVPANTIDRSILDTFGDLELSKPKTPEPLSLPRQERGGQPNQPAPASSLLDQLGRDFQNLGVGIKKTFSGIWPGQR